jgi:hypothetical protein
MNIFKCAVIQYPNVKSLSNSKYSLRGKVLEQYQENHEDLGLVYENYLKSLWD